MFLVVTEEYYGGALEIFKKKFDAEMYKDQIECEKNVDSIIIEFDMKLKGNVCFIVVTEEWYGGGKENIKCFSRNIDAEKYKFNIDKFDSIITKRKI